MARCLKSTERKTPGQLRAGQRRRTFQAIHAWPCVAVTTTIAHAEASTETRSIIGSGGGGAAATAKLQVASRAGLPPILLLCLFMTLLQSNTTHVREPLISVEQNRCSD